MPSHKTIVVNDVSKLSAQDLIDKINEECENNNIEPSDTTIDIDSDYDELTIISKSEYWPDEI